MSETQLERNISKSVIPDAYPQLELPDSVELSSVKIWSRGIPLDGDIYRPKQLQDSDKVAGVVLCHGLGGDKKSLERHAALLASQGIIAVTFTQGTWGQSGGNVLYRGDQPELDNNNRAQVEVQFIKNLVDPMDWIQNCRAAVDYLEGEPNIDPQRLGTWGTSFGGGIVIQEAASDERIKAMVTQVAAAPVAAGDLKKLAKMRAIDIARGNMDPIPQGIDPVPPYDCTLHLASTLQYNALDASTRLHVPSLIMAAENEEFFANADHSEKVFKNLEGRVPCHYEVIPDINHYGVYFDGYQQTSSKALKWFQKYL